jgi:hypothetical protein
MARTAILAIKIIADATQAAKGMDSAAGGVSKFERGMGKAAGAASVVVASLVGLGKAAFDEASNLQQAKGAVESVFKSQAPAVDALAKNAANAVGLAESEYSNLAVVLGSQLKNLGVSQDDLVGSTDNLIKQGADLSATFGGSTADAVSALSAALKGEMDPLEKYGISIKKADINARLAAEGHSKLTGAAKTQAETQALQAMIMEQSADATGAFAREADTAAGQQQRAAAATKNALADLGAVLLPMVTAAATQFAALAGFVSQNAQTFQVLAGVAGGLAVAIMATNAALSVFSTIQTIIANKAKIAAAAQWVWNAAMSANPIGIIIVAVALLIAGFVLLYKNSETFRAAVDKLVAGAKAGFAAVVAWVQRVAAAVVVVAAQIQAKFSAAWNAVRSAVSAVVAFISAVFTAYGVLVRAVLAAIVSVFKTAWAGIKTAVSAAVAFITAYIKKIQTDATTVANAVKRLFTAAWNAIKAAANTFATAITTVFNRIKATITTVATSIKSTLVAAFNALKSAGASAVNAILAPFRTIQGVINSVISAVQRLVNTLRNLKVPSLKFPSIPSVFRSASMAPAPGGTTAGLLTRGGGGVSSRATPAGGVVINVTGALDPEAVARQIERVLTSAQRRRGGVTLRQRAAGSAAPA